MARATMRMEEVFIKGDVQFRTATNGVEYAKFLVGLHNIPLCLMIWDDERKSNHFKSLKKALELKNKFESMNIEEKLSAIKDTNTGICDVIVPGETKLDITVKITAYAPDDRESGKKFRYTVSEWRHSDSYGARQEHMTNVAKKDETPIKAQIIDDLSEFEC